MTKKVLPPGVVLASLYFRQVPPAPTPLWLPRQGRLGRQRRMKARELWLFAPVFVCGNRPPDPLRQGWVVDAERREISGNRPIKLHVLLLEHDGQVQVRLVRRSRLMLRSSAPDPLQDGGLRPCRGASAPPCRRTGRDPDPATPQAQ